MIKAFLSRVKRRLLRKPYLKNPKLPGYWFDTVIGSAPAQLVQIGSNDGKTGDPLYPLFQKHSAWRGLLVEPIPYVFSKLSENYPDTFRFQLANVAITEGTDLPFYYVDKRAGSELPDLPYWYNQLGSFDREHIINELDGVLEPYILTMEVQGITLMDLLGKYGIVAIEVLHIDAEGYDWKVLRQLDLRQHQPLFILYESNHLSEQELAAARTFLAAHYLLFQVGIDVLAVNKTVGEAHLKQMKRHLHQVAS